MKLDPTEVGRRLRHLSNGRSPRRYEKAWPYSCARVSYLGNIPAVVRRTYCITLPARYGASRRRAR